MIRLLPVLLVCSAMAACISTRHAPVHDRPSATTYPPGPRSPAKTDPYEVFGQRYYPIKDATGYRERGVASWYGGKFHGRPTANGETYDMYQLTAAHTTLPLPTWVEVTNLRNGASVRVRVNDRGPFVKNRLIDLSYAAALQLGMIDDGTTLVEVEAIMTESNDTPSLRSSLPVTVPMVTMASLPAGSDSDPRSEPLAVAEEERQAPASVTQPPAAAGRATVYVQVGAFGERGNAEQLQTSLYNAGIAGVRLDSGDHLGAPVHRVQIGPIASVPEYDGLIAKLESIGIRDTHLVTE